MDPKSVSNSSYETTPIRSDSGISCSENRRPIYDRTLANPYKTPVRTKGYVGSLGFTRIHSLKKNVIETMPIYSPPSKSVSFVRNPFEHGKLLKERLSKPICSPSLFNNIANITSPSQTDQFSWSIEDISVFRPAEIDENPCQDFDSWFSPATENEAQEAINRFFSSQTIMVSPIAKDIIKAPTEAKRPECSTKWTQTTLTLPPVLPPAVEEVLKTYCLFSGGQQGQDEDLNTSSGSQSRKKLLFDDVTLSSESSNDSITSPPRNVKMESIRRDASCTPVTHHPSSPDWSPIAVDRQLGMSPTPMETSLLSRTALQILQLPSDQTSLSPKDKLKVCSTPMRMPMDEDSAFSSM